MKLAIVDFEKTLALSDGSLLSQTAKDINKYVLDNKLCILSEASYNELNELAKKYCLNCDYFSTSSAKGFINNEIIYKGINHLDLNYIIDKYSQYLYTAYFELDNESFIINYQERLDLIYPKNNRKIIEKLDKDITSITIAMNVGLIDDFYKDLDSLHLDYMVLAKDKNRNLVKISDNSYSTKENIVYLLKDIYKGLKTIGISDSLNDFKFVDACDIKIAMKKSELSSKISLETELENSLNGCMDMLFKIK